MADMDNFLEINQNFDTIKTLLNSIRAQGILNTSDVDKLLSGIYSKLEKINTEEDIDLIKIFLSELKQNLDERHSVLVSKFGAIESLFSNLLKNSSEMPKANDIKELFDIVATNLSVFSREVVSQKETLTDITLRIDALRSDDSQKREIIKNITLLKPDLERLNNGFDSIVLSLNDNFKTIVKTITTIDKTEYLEKFADNLNSIELSSNTILSALQMLGKKTEQVEEALQNLATKDDITSSNQRLFELTAQSHELSATISDLSNKYIRIDNLADKIDASVNIIATLKSVLEEADDKRTGAILEQLRGLEVQLQTITSDTKFDNFKNSLEGILNNISESTLLLDKNLSLSSQEIQKIVNLINSLDINVSFQNIIFAINKVETDVKTSINEVSQKLSTLQDANITRVLNDISSNADSLGSKLNQTQSAIAVLCEKNFSSVVENITDLKGLVSQLDENNVSANNAIFSSITDRLTVFENSLKISLDAQEKTLNNSSEQLAEQIDNLKNLSGVLDYKMDSSVIEVGNIKREFSTLKTAVEDVLALDFVNTVKDLRVDLYASKQELVNSFESTNTELSERITSDLYGKYELLISKLDSVEDEFKKSQAESLIDLKSILDKISASIIDVISYVTETTSTNSSSSDDKIEKIADVIKENSLDYVETIRDIVDVIRVQVDNNLKNFEEENATKFDSVNRTISENSEDIKKELKYSYSKLIEIQDAYNELKEILNVTNLSSEERFNGIITSTESAKADFDNKLVILKNSLLEKISDFKQEFTCENADKVGELKFAVENLYNKNTQDFTALLEDLREQLKTLVVDDSNEKAATLAKILDNFVSVKDLMKSFNEQASSKMHSRTEEIIEDINDVKDLIDSLHEQSVQDLNFKTSEIFNNFITLKDLIKSLNGQSSQELNEKTDKILLDFQGIKELIKTLNHQSAQDLGIKADNIDKKFNEFIELVKTLNHKSNENFDNTVETLTNDLTNFKEALETINNNTNNLLDQKTSGIIKNIDELKKHIDALSTNASQDLNFNINKIISNFNELTDLIKSLNYKSSQDLNDTTEKISVMTSELKNTIESLSYQTNALLDIKANSISKSFTEIKQLLETLNEHSANNLSLKVKEILDDFASVKLILERVDENIDGDMTRQLSIIESNFESLVSQITILFDKSSLTLAERINEEFSNVSDKIQVAITERLEDYKITIEETIERLQGKTAEQSIYLEEKIAGLNLALKNVWEEQTEINSKQIDEIAASLRETIDENIKLTSVDYIALKNRIGDFAKNIENNNEILEQSIKAQLAEITSYIEESAEKDSQEAYAQHCELVSTIKDFSTDSVTLHEELKAQLKEQDSSIKATQLEIDNLRQVVAKDSSLVGYKENLSSEHNELALAIKNSTEAISTLSDDFKNITNEQLYLSRTSSEDLSKLVKMYANNHSLIEDLGTGIKEQQTGLIKSAIDASSTGFQTISDYAERILALIEEEKQHALLYKNLYVEILKKELEFVSKKMEQEADDVVSELAQKLDLLQKSQTEDIINLTSKIETIINTYISNSVNNLKSYIEEKTDSTTLVGLIDNLKLELSTSVEDLIGQLNKFLHTDVFVKSMDDFRIVNETLVSSAVERINLKIDTFVTNNFNELNTKISTLDEKLVGTIVSKYEELKLISNKYGNSFVNIQNSIQKAFTEFEDVKTSINSRLDLLETTVISAADNTNKEINALNTCFENLRSQISNKSFDEAFQASMNKQISELQNLINEQLGYLEDINNLCVNSLPDVTELNTLVKYSILETIKKFSEQLESVNLKGELDEANADVKLFVKETIEEQNFAESFNTIEHNIIQQVGDIIETQDIANSLEHLESSVVAQISDKIDAQDIAKNFENIEANIIDWVSDKIDSQEIKTNLNELETNIVSKLTDKIEAQNIENQLANIETNVLDSISRAINSQDITENLNLVETNIIDSITDKIEAQDLTNNFNYLESSIVDKLSDKIEAHDINEKLDQVASDVIEAISNNNGAQDIVASLNQTKSDIITQFLNVFNQISFIAEQEEILDFIQEKHDELITILSHIVTTSSEVGLIRDSLTIVDNKIDNLKEDIDLINEKITAIMSSDGDIDYVYSLQEIESDIAGLRLALNEMKENSHGQEFNDLISSTNEIYKLVESIKSEIPNKTDFEGLAEDIVSISTRTNKLILASDESYKTLQDNLQDFKLVINDLDERTRNFAQESGMDRIDSKLNAINNMMVSGAKTNQVFNQIFEYLAEWVDNASTQINSISGKIETLDDIGQIKNMLSELKAGAEDNSESVELIEALGTVFDKQTKRFTALETKLDKIIVETTISNKNNKIDLTPLEGTLNRFLVVMDEKMSSQQAKIDSLEAKLENVMELINEKETAQLSKKVGGMDRQIAKLNKSIEKIASHVVEK